jgi:PEP-CTERM motif
MKKILVALSILMLVFSVTAYAAPVTYEGMATEGSSFSKTITLGATLDFDYWFVMGITPPPYDGGGFDALFTQDASAGYESLGSLYSYEDSPGWLSASLPVPVGLQGTTGLIVFGVDDFGPDTNPTVYLNNVGGPTNVPEPSTLFLLGSGLLGLVGYGRKRMKK